MPQGWGPEAQGQQVRGVWGVRPDQQAPGGTLRVGEPRGAPGPDEPAQGCPGLMSERLHKGSWTC